MCRLLIWERRNLLLFEMILKGVGRHEWFLPSPSVEMSFRRLLRQGKVLRVYVGMFASVWECTLVSEKKIILPNIKEVFFSFFWYCFSMCTSPFFIFVFLAALWLRFHRLHIFMYSLSAETAFRFRIVMACRATSVSRKSRKRIRMFTKESQKLRRKSQSSAPRRLT